MMELLARVGEKALKRALAESAAEGRGGLHIDGDSTLIELHGTQEGSSYNGHYHCTGYHAGWMVDTEVGKVAALWLNPGKRVKAFASANLTMFRAHALKLFNVFVKHGRGEKVRVHPTLLRPGWPEILLEATHALE